MLIKHKSFQMTNGLEPSRGLIKRSWFCMRGGYQKLVKLVWFDQNRPRKSSSYLNMKWLFPPMCLFLGKCYPQNRWDLFGAPLKCPTLRLLVIAIYGESLYKMDQLSFLVKVTWITFDHLIRLNVILLQVVLILYFEFYFEHDSWTIL